MNVRGVEASVHALLRTCATRFDPAQLPSYAPPVPELGMQ
jgi:hypothetical protein